MIAQCQETVDRFTVPGEGWPTEQQRYYYPPFKSPLRNGIRVSRFEMEGAQDESVPEKWKRVVSRIVSEIDAVVRAKAAKGATPRVHGALAALDQIAALPRDWDTYGSPPVPETAVRQARAIVIVLHMAQCPDPIVSPVPGGGGVQLEWNKGKRGVEVYIDAYGEVSYLRTDNDKEIVLGTSPTRAGFEINKILDWVRAA